MSVRCAIAALFLAAACASGVEPQTALEALVAAEKALAAGDSDRALDLLESVAPESFEDVDRPRYAVDLGRARFMNEDYWGAFEAVRDVPRDYPGSPFLAKAEEIEFKAGAVLAGRGGGFLFFTSDLSDARRILEHFILFYPTSSWLPDALRILGEAAYQDEDWQLAIDRFGELLQRAPEGEWSDLAAFRIAMSHYHLVAGPDYDLERLENARRELAAYLAGKRPNPDFVEEARRALDRILYWIDEKHLIIADFYLRIDKPEGARFHLEKILARPDSPLYEAAKERLAEIPAPPPRPDPRSRPARRAAAGHGGGRR